MAASNSGSRTSVTDLPDDILYLIFPYLTAFEFLNFTSCTRALFPHCQDPTFWRTLTRKTFRLPPQPLLQGKRWQWLYKKLLTQARVYTWGDNKSGNLGHFRPWDNMSRGYDEAYRRRSGWPRQPKIDVDVGIISDVQCGGWSTTFLNSRGQIFMFGIFDGLSLAVSNRSELKQLSFPVGYPPTTKDRYEPSTAIKQFSTGRSSVLGLSDDGKVWSWTGESGTIGVSVKSVHVDMIEHQVLEVQAGWNRNSMYVQDVGIVYWSDDSDSALVEGGQQQALAFADTILIDTVTIPGTSYRWNQKMRNSTLETAESLEARIGEVTHYVVLDVHIVFTTHHNKIYSFPTIYPLAAESRPEPVELTTFYESSPDPCQIDDLQGSYTNFAVFLKDGTILTGTRDFLDTFHRIAENPGQASPISLPTPLILPSLQSSTVVSLAFGDHHFHALHSNGTVTSLGKELQSCGALGLGSPNSAFRGVLSTRHRWGDGYVPHDTPTRRTVWFEPLMWKWFNHLIRKSRFPGNEAESRTQLIESGDRFAREAIGDWFEQEGRKWEDGTSSEEEQGGLGAYFVLKVAAAGWHSAALVLVDDEKVERARGKYIRRLNNDSKDAEFTTSSLASNSTVDSPTRGQLASTVYSFYCGLWDLGRWFLGLQRRDEINSDAAVAAAAAARGPGPAQRRDNIDSDEEFGEEGVRYMWKSDVMPRLRMGDGRIMPGTKEVLE